jgi:hypothetical protein
MLSLQLELLATQRSSRLSQSPSCMQRAALRQSSSEPTTHLLSSWRHVPSMAQAFDARQCASLPAWQRPAAFNAHSPKPLHLAAVVQCSGLVATHSPFRRAHSPAWWHQNDDAQAASRVATHVPRLAVHLAEF